MSNNYSMNIWQDWFPFLFLSFAVVSNDGKDELSIWTRIEDDKAPTKEYSYIFRYIA